MTSLHTKILLKAQQYSDYWQMQGDKVWEGPTSELLENVSLKLNYVPCPKPMLLEDAVQKLLDAIKIKAFLWRFPPFFFLLLLCSCPQ